MILTISFSPNNQPHEILVTQEILVPMVTYLDVILVILVSLRWILVPMVTTQQQPPEILVLVSLKWILEILVTAPQQQHEILVILVPLWTLYSNTKSGRLGGGAGIPPSAPPTIKRGVGVC